MTQLMTRGYTSPAEKAFRVAGLLTLPLALIAPNAAGFFFICGIACFVISVAIGVRRDNVASKYLGTPDAHKYGEWKRKTILK